MHNISNSTNDVLDDLRVFFQPQNKAEQSNKSEFFFIYTFSNFMNSFLKEKWLI